MSTEAQCPFHQTAGGGTTNRDWWPNQLRLDLLQPALVEVRPDGRRLRLRRGIQEPRPRGRQEGPARADDRLAGLVAGRLRPLRAALHPHGVAQRRHLSHRRRPRRRRPRPAALRAAQQLARQRQPRQGAPAALADQAEVRPQDLLGRPDDPRRQRRARDHGLQDLRLRRRPGRRVGARPGRVLGPRDEVARRRRALCAGLARRRGGPRRAREGRRQQGAASRATSRTRSLPCRWASSTSTPKAPTASPTRSPPRTTSATPSAAWRWTTRRPSPSSPAATPSARRTARHPRTTSARNPRPPASRRRASAGRTASAPARAATRSPAASRSPGRRRRRSGATTSSRTCSASSGS